jgi:hypothetical protein
MRPNIRTHTSVRTVATMNRDVDAAARRLYDAEVALHAAHASQVDAWIAAAADRLHDAIAAHLTAVASAA